MSKLKNSDSRKYGVVEDKKFVEAFHRSRRMFAIIDDKLVVAEPNLPYSHLQWLRKLNLEPIKQEKVMQEEVRGMIDAKGDVYFYTGYDFKLTPEIERAFKKHLQELINKSGIKETAKVYGGLIKQKESKKIWPPQKSFGIIEGILKSE
jgi:hypothetical protein